MKDTMQKAEGRGILDRPLRQRRSRDRLRTPALWCFLFGLFPALAQASPYATNVYSYLHGAMTESPPSSGLLYDNPAAALGAPDPLAAWDEPSASVVQLGQGGSITLRFDEPIYNKSPGQRADNPLGADFVIFGNAFELGGRDLTGIFYSEPGFVEVAKKNTDGTPGMFYLVLPTKLPSQLVGETDTGQVTTLLDFYADVHPVDGSGNHLIGPDQAGSAGGDAFFLERAVLQASPGVPLLDGNNQVQYVALDSVDFVRITDALAGDILHDTNNNVVGGITTDIDAVVALPAVPEPGIAPMLVVAMLGLRRRIISKGRR